MNKSDESITIQTTLPVVKVKVERGEANQMEFTFTEPFSIGRDESCDVRIQDPAVSRIHAEVYYGDGRWKVRDLQSANGTYIDGKKIDRFPLTKPIKLELSLDGPIVSLAVEEMREQYPTIVKKGPSVSQYIKQYISTSIGKNAGKTTMLIREAIDRIQKKQRRKYQIIIVLIVFLFLITGTYSIYQHIAIRNMKSSAADIFYNMKTVELEIAQLKNKLKDVDQSENLLTEMNEDYDQLLDKLGLYRKNISEEERLILRIARIFGECEINLPELFIQEVKKYISKWQSTTDLQEAIKRAKENEYIDDIIRVMIEHGLPPHYFYLALQESGFDQNACGPRTRYGYAKGMWQFIPDTAREYGLQLGRNYEFRVYDPADERHDFEKSTNAAARYIRDIYNTEAQASGLLVMASYNWGQTRVRRLINQMSKNPRDRNFWCLLELYEDKIPEQTYNYVFRILSAAVIGEYPQMFGFDFDSPLAHIEGLSSR